MARAAITTGRPQRRRRWARWVLLGSLALVVAEVSTLVVLADQLGLLTTLALLVVMGLAGGLLASQQGRATWRALRSTTGDSAARTVSDAALVLVGALLLVLPGIISDVLGLLLIIPATRGLVRRALHLGVGRRVTREAEAVRARLADEVADSFGGASRFRNDSSRPTVQGTVVRDEDESS